MLQQPVQRIRAPMLSKPVFVFCFLLALNNRIKKTWALTRKNPKVSAKYTYKTHAMASWSQIDADRWGVQQQETKKTISFSLKYLST